MASTEVTIGFIICLTAFAISAGVSFGTLFVTMQGAGSNRRLLAFCTTLIAWSVVYLLVALQGQTITDQPLRVWQVVGSTLTLSGFTYLIIVVPYFRAGDRLAQIALIFAPIGVVIALIIIWSGAAFATLPMLDTAGVIVLSIGLIYSVIALWSLLTSPHKLAVRLRVPAVLVVLALISETVYTFRPYAIGLLIMSIAALWIGSVILRDKIFKPVYDLRDELRVANQDLRQVVADLATERGRSAELSKQLSASQEYGQAKLDFLDRLGHRLRTLLNSIGGYTELLVTGVYGDLTDKQKDRMEVIHRNSVVLLALIRDMLDLNVLDAGQMTLQLRSMSLYGLIQQAITKLTSASGGQSPPIVLEIPHDVHPIMADEERFPQLLAHVLNYALESDHEPTITLTVRNVLVKNGIGQSFTLPLIGWLTDGEWVITEVNVPGLQLSPGVQSSLFEAFADTDDQAVLSHTGLGLTIARKLIELHQGALWVKSQAELGTQFYLALHAVPLTQ